MPWNSSYEGKGKEGRKERKGLCGENSQAGLGCNMQLWSLLPAFHPPPPHQPRLRKKVRPKEIPDRNPGEGRAAGPRGRSLHETVAHRDAQKSVHSSNQRFLK